MTHPLLKNADPALIHFLPRERAVPGAPRGFGIIRAPDMVSDASYPCCSNGGYGYENLRPYPPLAVDRWL